MDHPNREAARFSRIARSTVRCAPIADKDPALDSATSPSAHHSSQDFCSAFSSALLRDPDTAHPSSAAAEHQDHDKPVYLVPDLLPERRGLDTKVDQNLDTHSRGFRGVGDRNYRVEVCR